MDYEKKYNEILAWAKKYKARLNGVPIEDIFPELRESEDEDERIRKGIIEIIKAVSGPDCDVYLDEKKREKYLAYLEKQKEQKHAPDDLQKSFEAGQTSIVDNPEKYGLCKVVEWNDEDEDYMNAIITIINRETALYPKGGATEDLNNDLIAWLKSLRPSWKPSEEQMEALEIIVRYGDKESTHIKNLTSLYEQLQKL